MTMRRADRLALGDSFQLSPRDTIYRIVSVGFTNLSGPTAKMAVRIAIQDPYTPPDAFKVLMLAADQEVEVLDG